MSDARNLIAVIPARRGSKRLPGKNIRTLCGHPLLAYAVASADDPLAGQIAEWYGAEYMARPAELATDTASLVDVMLHVLQEVADQGGHMPKALCQLMPNCPLRRHDDIARLYDAFRRGGRCFQMSVVPYRGVYPQWAIAADEDGEGRWVFGGDNLVNSQELLDTYCPTGAVWWASVPDLFEQRAFYGVPFHIEAMDANRGLDIDREDELELADLIVRGLRDRDGSPALEDVGREPFPEATTW